LARLLARKAEHFSAGMITMTLHDFAAALTFDRDALARWIHG
jgi:hypothetical protein